MGKIIGINPDYDYLFDPKQARTYGECPRCGGDIYTKGQRLCSYCQDEIDLDGWCEQWD